MITFRGGILLTEAEVLGVKALIEEDEASKALFYASSRKIATSRRDDARWIEELTI